MNIREDVLQEPGPWSHDLFMHMGPFYEVRLVSFVYIMGLGGKCRRWKREPPRTAVALEWSSCYDSIPTTTDAPEQLDPSARLTLRIKHELLQGSLQMALIWPWFYRWWVVIVGQQSATWTHVIRHTTWGSIPPTANSFRLLKLYIFPQSWVLEIEYAWTPGTCSQKTILHGFQFCL